MKGRKIFDYSFLALGLLIQVVTYTLMPHDSWLSLLCGCLGVCTVVLSAQGNICFFFYDTAHVEIYTYLCYTQRFYGEIGINIYYFFTMIYGVYVWRQRLRVNEEGGAAETRIEPRHLGWPVLASIAVATLVGAQLVGWGLASWTDDTQPYLDAYTTVPALVGQVLLILVYREHWFFWLAVDLLSVVLWLRAGDYCMAAQYAFWCANCLYGLHRWKSLTSHLAS